MVKKISKHTSEQIVRKLDKAQEIRGSGVTTAQILIEVGLAKRDRTGGKRPMGSMTKREVKELERLRNESSLLKCVLGQVGLEK
ncbi:hypothetical protein [Arcanobacterium phocae]|uniref:hypothetical protein n=1 Tax=Arcanobacterium phocae TaxID=131112 RepID=UPI001C0ECF7F|nr:hypothetical protein [Arcanobacterium phocae]